jgi:ankyrin repeat protein
MVAAVTGESRADCKKCFQKGLEVVGAMRLAGVKLLAGTDTAMPYCFPGFGLHDELALLVQAGLSPMEALRTATYNPAEFLGRLDSLGTIEQGKIADLVLLEANPLQDITNTQKIAAVVFGGKIFEKRLLQKMFAQIEASHLHKAAVEGKIAHVKLLISRGADVNARDQQGWTPALAALGSWELAVTDLLLENGADSSTPHLAAYTGDLPGVKKLLEKEAPVDRLEGLTLLHAAAAGGHGDVVEFLIAEGFDSAATTENGSTPLHFAALGNHQKVAEILVANGAPVDSGETTPIVAAAYAGHKDMIELLMSKGADINKGPEPPLYQAVDWWETLDMAKLLLEAGADINARNKEGNTPLHSTARYRRLEMAAFLVSKGADVDAKNHQGESPSSIAEKNDHKDIDSGFQVFQFDDLFL